MCSYINEYYSCMYNYYELVLSGFVNGILADTVYGRFFEGENLCV